MVTDPALDVHPFPGYELLTFAVENGDGEPSLLHPRLELQRVIAPWFRSPLGQWGPAWLMRVTEGAQKGLLLALTPRGTTIPIEEQLARSREYLKSLSGVRSALGMEEPKYVPWSNGSAGVVLHTIKSPGPDFRGDGSDTHAAGMTVLEQL